MILRLHPCNRRSGMTLLEVLTATAIFLMAIAALSQIVGTATERAVDVQHQSQGTNLAQAKLAEVVSGAIPLTAQSQTPFSEDELGDDAGNWAWSLDVAPLTIANGSGISSQAQNYSQYATVKISCQRSNGEWETVASLSQVVLAVSQRGSSTDPVPTNPANSTTSSSSSQGGTTTPTSPTTPSGSTPPAGTKGSGTTGAGGMSSGAGTGTKAGTGSTGGMP